MAASGGAKTLTSSSSSAASVSQFWSTLPLRSSSQFLQGQIIRSLFSFEKELSILQDLQPIPFDFQRDLISH
ncbi:hypothetical protein HanXRQr2_Chr13g0611161 [Helianthus annuus]|uniref:Uncharacterized protein n=1 Tax=Helianthus annuus TaxID=4232 RepID=A0A251SX71_HELAN|nr:hypothetical protein HanXRQr2_Chr13g0611161 [Helianthus annuus]